MAGEHGITCWGSRAQRDSAFTVHAELEGRALWPTLQRLLSPWRTESYRVTSLATDAVGLESTCLPRCRIVASKVEGRSRLLASQAVAEEHCAAHTSVCLMRWVWAPKGAESTWVCTSGKPGGAAPVQRLHLRSSQSRHVGFHRIADASLEIGQVPIALRKAVQ